MFKKLEITGIKVDLDDSLKKYVNNKIGKLDKYLPKNIREAAHVGVLLKELKPNSKNNCVCEVVINLPKDRIVITEGTLNMYAAIDIVEEKLKNQFTKYKQKHISKKFFRHISARLNKTQ